MVSVERACRRLVRLRNQDGRMQIGSVVGDAISVLATDDVLTALTAERLPAVVDRIPVLDPASYIPPEPWKLLAPLDPPETWAAGVTYERSRDARLHESRVANVYDLVYEAERPELFIKDAAGRRTVGPGEPIATRTDSSWTVPEPELAVVLGDDGRPLAATIGNDVSSRDIEGANPLYIPQAKIYAGACALGPALLVPHDWSAPFEIELRILSADGESLFQGHTSTSNMRRSLDELIEFLRRDNPVPRGTVLLTGTGLVPPDEVTLLPGQSVEIEISGIGTLCNPVAVPAQPCRHHEEASHV